VTLLDETMKDHRMRTVRPVPTPRATVYQMAYFPPAEYEAAWAHGLLNATSYRDHADYRRETEQALRAMAEPPVLHRLALRDRSRCDQLAAGTQRALLVRLRREV
jgi:hypothetical protein